MAKDTAYQSLEKYFRRWFAPDVIAKAERIVAAKNRASNGNAGRFVWTAERVLIVALQNGLDELERRCCREESEEDLEKVTA
jgi:hypothetical protein